jgi:hypothetical protein
MVIPSGDEKQGSIYARESDQSSLTRYSKDTIQVEAFGIPRYKLFVDGLIEKIQEPRNRSRSAFEWTTLHDIGTPTLPSIANLRSGLEPRSLRSFSNSSDYLLKWYFTSYFCFHCSTSAVLSVVHECQYNRSPPFHHAPFHPRQQLLGGPGVDRKQPYRCIRNFSNRSRRRIRFSNQLFNTLQVLWKKPVHFWQMDQYVNFVDSDKYWST